MGHHQTLTKGLLSATLTHSAPNHVYNSPSSEQRPQGTDQERAQIAHTFLRPAQTSGLLDSQAPALPDPRPSPAALPPSPSQPESRPLRAAPRPQQPRPGRWGTLSLPTKGLAAPVARPISPPAPHLVSRGMLLLSSQLSWA